MKSRTRLVLKNLRRYCQTSANGRSVPKEADVVVIGGGSLGCNTLYHLTKLGLKNCVLLEKNRLTSGTTWHTAGLLWRVRSTDVDIQLVDRTRQLNTGLLEQETGIHTGWIQNGGMLVATKPHRLAEVKRFHALAKYMGIECYMISGTEVKDLYPLMKTDDILGALYTPGDGLLDPSGLMNALTTAAKKEGAEVFENCIVNDIESTVNQFGSKQVTAVHTSLGSIKTQAVVCCGGAWSPKLGAMVGVPVPLVPFKHCYIITGMLLSDESWMESTPKMRIEVELANAIGKLNLDKVPGLENVPNVRDPDGSVYLRLQGNALEVGGFESSPISVPNLPDEFAFSLFDFPWDSFAEIYEAGMRRVPKLEHTGVKKEVCGPESFTPDHQPLFGEAPQCRGFYLGCGLNSQGMMYGGGFGEQLAKWVVNGRPDRHMYKFDIRRYNPSLLTDAKWVLDKTQEGLSHNYSIGFIHDESLAGRNAITDPLHETLLQQGAVFEARMGWERASWFATEGPITPVLPYDYYGGYGLPKHENYPYYHQRLTTGYSFEIPQNHDIIANEALTCRRGVALFNMSSFGKFFLTGPDAQKAADYVFTNDMRKLPGQTIYTCMLSPKGLLEMDLTVSPIQSDLSGYAFAPAFAGQGFYILTGGTTRVQSYIHMQNMIQDAGLRAELYDATFDVCMLSLQGPYSQRVLQGLTDTDLSDTEFPFSTHKVVNIAGIPCRILRVSFVGELGYELHVSWNDSVPLYNALMEEGADLGIVNAGYRAIGSLSAEKGFPLWAQDIRHTDSPFEVGLGFACKLKSDVDFVGRSALEQQKSNLKKRLDRKSVV